MLTGRPVLTCKVAPSKIEKLEFSVILNAQIISRIAFGECVGRSS